MNPIKQIVGGLALLLIMLILMLEAIVLLPISLLFDTNVFDRPIIWLCAVGDHIAAQLKVKP